MNFLNGENYVEVKDKRNIIHPREDIILRERKTPKSLRTQNQEQNNYSSQGRYHITGTKNSQKF